MKEFMTVDWIQQIDWHNWDRWLIEATWRFFTIVPATVLGVWLAARLKARKELEKETKVIKARLDSEVAKWKMELTEEDTVRKSQLLEQELYDRILIIDSVRDFLTGVKPVVTMRRLSLSGHRSEAEEKRYRQLKHFMEANIADPAHPEKNAGLRLTFHLFRALAAVRIAMGARSTRLLSVSHERILAIWDRKLLPGMTSPTYPGRKFFYVEQLRYITEAFVTTDGINGQKRPLNWPEFCRTFDEGSDEHDETLNAVTSHVWSQIRSVFDEKTIFADRRLTQVRLAIMALYLYKLALDCEALNIEFRKSAYAQFNINLANTGKANAGAPNINTAADNRTNLETLYANQIEAHYKKRAGELKEMIGEQWKWEFDNGKLARHWYVYAHGDAERWSRGEFDRDEF